MCIQASSGHSSLVVPASSMQVRVAPERSSMESTHPIMCMCAYCTTIRFHPASSHSAQNAHVLAVPLSGGLLHPCFQPIMCMGARYISIKWPLACMPVELLSGGLQHPLAQSIMCMSACSNRYFAGPSSQTSGSPCLKHAYRVAPGRPSMERTWPMMRMHAYYYQVVSCVLMTSPYCTCVPVLEVLQLVSPPKPL